MSITITNLIDKLDLGMIEKTIHRVCASFCDRKSSQGICRASLKKIAQRAGCCLSTVKKYIRTLIQKGYWFREYRQHKNGRQTTNLLKFNFIKHYEELGYQFHSDTENPKPPQAEDDVLTLSSIDQMVDEWADRMEGVDNTPIACGQPVEEQGGRGRGLPPSKENHYSSLISLSSSINLSNNNSVDNSTTTPKECTIPIQNYLKSMREAIKEHERHTIVQSKEIGRDVLSQQSRLSYPLRT